MGIAGDIIIIVIAALLARVATQNPPCMAT